MHKATLALMSALALTTSASAQWPFQVPDDENELFFVWAIAHDTQGNAFVSSNWTDNIWKIDAEGGTVLFYDASKDPQRLVIQPTRIECDPAGNLYISSGQTTGIVRVAPDASVSYAIPPWQDPFAGGVASVLLDEEGNLYAADNWSDVRKLAPDGTLSIVLDASGDGQGNTLEYPTDMTTGKDGNLFVSGRDNVFRVDTSGTITEVLDISALAASWHFPSKTSAIATDSAGNLYLASKYYVHKVTLSGESTILLAPDSIPLPQFADIEVDPVGNVYVSDFQNHRVYHISPAGTVHVAIDARGDRQGNTLRNPGQLALTPQGRLYVVSTLNDKVFDLPPPQYFLVVGDSDDRGSFRHGLRGHRFTTQVGRALYGRRLSIDELPSVPIGALPFSRPSDPITTRGDAPFPIDELFAQILVYHPQVYRQQPERFSTPMRLQLWSNGALTGVETGQPKGLHLDLRVERDSGGAGHIDLPFVPYR